MDKHTHDTKEVKKKNTLISAEEYNSLREKASKSDDYFERLVRLQADFDNYKKRLEKEKTEFIKYANEEIILDVLRLLDDFERAVEAGKAKQDFDVLYTGIEMIYKDLKGFLK